MNEAKWLFSIHFRGYLYFFEAALAVAKISLSLKPKHHNKVTPDTYCKQSTSSSKILTKSISVLISTPGILTKLGHFLHVVKTEVKVPVFEITVMQSCLYQVPLSLICHFHYTLNGNDLDIENLDFLSWVILKLTKKLFLSINDLT